MRAVIVAVALLSASPALAQDSDMLQYYRDRKIERAAAYAHRQAVLDASCAKLGKVKLGMTPAEVLKTCWGKPDSVNRTVTATRDHQQWVYGIRQYLYFDDGVVTAVQQSR
jgi:hypothetical protein